MPMSIGAMPMTLMSVTNEEAMNIQIAAINMDTGEPIYDQSFRLEDLVKRDNNNAVFNGIALQMRHAIEAYKPRIRIPADAPEPELVNVVDGKGLTLNRGTPFDAASVDSNDLMGGSTDLGY